MVSVAGPRDFPGHAPNITHLSGLCSASSSFAAYVWKEKCNMEQSPAATKVRMFSVVATSASSKTDKSNSSVGKAEI